MTARPVRTSVRRIKLSGRDIDHVVVAVQDLERAGTIYQELGFTLTPRARHDDRMGTSNRLAQFAGKNFIELLEVDRPDRLVHHDFEASPPFFSFGDHNRRAVRERDGLSMMVFKGDNARSDISSLAASSCDLCAIQLRARRQDAGWIRGDSRFLAGLCPIPGHAEGRLLCL